MKVILLQDVKAQGKAGDVVNVSDGYATNFLIKNKLAEEATASRLAQLRDKQSSNAHRKEVERQEYVALCEKIDETTVTLSVKCGEGGKVFGSIQSAQIADAMAKQGISVDKKKIVLSSPIKAVGTYKVDVHPYPEVTGKLTVIVVSQ